MFEPRMQEFISELIHAGHESPPSRFKPDVLELLRGLIPFDGALWASGRGEDRTVHNVYLYGLPPDMMQSWEKIKHQDRILNDIIANPGKTIDVFDSYSRMERPQMEVYQQHSKQYGIEAVISTALPDEKLGLLEVMSLYRGAADPGFSRAEREIKQSLFPFMNQVWHHNQIQNLKHACGCAQRGAAAICDTLGWLRHAESRFGDLLKEEFGKWQAPKLPEALRNWLAQPGRDEYQGERVKFIKTLQNDLILLQVQSLGVLSLLTSRESEIAGLFASGLTSPQIAETLHVSNSTVRRHLESIYRKLEISSKVELVQALNGSGPAG